MATDYNSIAQEYRDSKQMPWRLYAELPTLMGILGDISGLSVLDLACGEGFYTRRLKAAGASDVVGVDLSGAMIAMAEQSEDEHPLGIRYIEKDVYDLDLPQQFDVVAASYLLNYAPTEEQLLKMFMVIARHLKPGGRFVTVNNNPDCHCEPAEMRHYGFTRESTGLTEGSEIIYRFHADNGGVIAVINYQLHRSTHERCMALAGFGEIVWHDIRISETGKELFPGSYWDAILQHQPIVGLSCRKRATAD